MSGVECLDNIPANTVYVDGSASGPGGCVISVSPTTLYYSNITVPARGRVILMFKVKVDNPLAPGVTEISNQGLISYDKDGNGINDTQLPTDGNTVLPGDQETIVELKTGPNFGDTFKTAAIVRDKDNDGILSPGDVIRYTVLIVNSGDTDAFNVIFTDPIPDDTSYVSNSVSATSGSISFDSAANRVLWTGDVPMGGSVTITFDVVVHLGIPPQTVISNQGIVDYDSNGDGTNDSMLPTDGNTTLPGRQPTDLIVGSIPNIPAVKTAVPLNSVLPTPGDDLRFDILLENPTGYLLTGLELIDSIPAYTTLVPDTVSVPPGAVVISEPPTLRVTGISIAPFSKVLISFTVRIDNPLPPGIDSIMNQGTINFDSNGDGTNDRTALTDWNTDIPGDQPTVIVIACPVVEITDISLEETVYCGDDIEYLVEYTNTSSVPARNVLITSIYDERTAFHSSFPDPDPGTTNTWTIGTVEPGQTGSIRIKVSVVYRMPYLYIAQHRVTITTHCDTRQAGTRTNVLGCGPR